MDRLISCGLLAGLLACSFSPASGQQYSLDSAIAAFGRSVPLVVAEEGGGRTSRGSGAYIGGLSSEASAQYCFGPGCGVRVYAPGVFVDVGAPPVIYQPQITYQPMEHQGTVLQRRVYRGPLWNLMFGRYRVIHQYGPIKQRAGNSQ